MLNDKNDCKFQFFPSMKDCSCHDFFTFESEKIAKYMLAKGDVLKKIENSRKERQRERYVSLL